MSSNLEIKTLPVRFISDPRTANAFLIKGECNVLVDNGPKQSPTDGYLFQELKKNSADPGSIKPVLFTHGHQDHVGGANVLQALGADLYISKPDAIFLQNHPEAFKSDLLLLARMKGLDISVAEENFRKTMPDEVAEVQLIAVGDTLEFGDVKLDVIDMAGHTYGSVGLYLEREGVLFGGDAICGTGPRQGCLPLIYSLDDYIETTKRIQRSGIGHILLAHDFLAPGLKPDYDQSGAGLPLYLSISAEVAERVRDEAAKCAGQREEPFIQVCNQILGALPEVFGFMPIEQQVMPEMTLRTLIFALRDFAGWEV